MILNWLQFEKLNTLLVIFSYRIHTFVDEQIILFEERITWCALCTSWTSVMIDPLRFKTGNPLRHDSQPAVVALEILTRSSFRVLEIFGLFSFTWAMEKIWESSRIRTTTLGSEMCNDPFQKTSVEDALFPIPAVLLAYVYPFKFHAELQAIQ